VSVVVLGIAGGTGSGKTTVAREIAARIGAGRAALLEQDSYYRDQSHLPMDDRRTVNYDHPDSFDMALLISHVDHFRRGEPVNKPLYSFETYARLDGSEVVDPSPVLIVEGIMVLVDEELRRRLDIKVFVDADADVRFIRRVLRDVKERGRSLDSVVHQYLSVVRPMHLQFVEPSKRYADVIVPEGGHNHVAVDLIATRVRAVSAG
jgi:uridine kinase